MSTPGKKKSYYEKQKGKTATNKKRREVKRIKSLAKWVSKGIKKNGKPVLSMDQRKQRAADRKQARETAKTEARKLKTQNRMQQDGSSKQSVSKKPVSKKPINEED
jgi:hypothetical protein